jgi:transposase-like protein
MSQECPPIVKLTIPPIVKLTIPPIVKLTIEEVQEQFILWRNTRRCRGSVPEQLWEAAVSLAEDHSIGQICKVLGLNNRQLKRRIQARSDNGYQEKKEVAEGKSYHFVELAVSRPGSDEVSEPESDAEYVMEMEDQKGGKLKVHIKGTGASFNLLEIAKAFLGRDK